MKRPLKITLSLLLIAVVATASLYAGFLLGQSAGALSDTSEIAYYYRFLEAQRSQGTDEAYEEALRGYLSLRDAKKGKWDMVFSERIHAIDSALTHARLSVLARKRGAETEAKQHLALAESFCPKIGWKEECSAEKIVFLAKHLDENFRK